MSHWYSMQLSATGQPLQRIDHDTLPVAGAGQVVICVKACGVCRTDLHIVDGDLSFPSHPVVPGHEVVGTVVALGAGITSVKEGDRVGVPWLGWTCGNCEACSSGHENLCEKARFTGYQIPGGMPSTQLPMCVMCSPYRPPTPTSRPRRYSALA